MKQNSTSIAKLLGNRALLDVFFILAAATVVMLPIFIGGFSRGSDIGFHLRWNTWFAEELRQGNLYPRWLSAANRGYGSPVGLYYPPLQFYVTAAINFFVHDILRAMALACWLATALGGLMMYRFSNNLLPRQYSLVAALLYLAAPYHLLDLYRGGALSQYWSYVCIPLALHTIYRIAAPRRWRSVVYLAVSYALLCLTHLPLAFATTLSLPLAVVALTYRRNRKPFESANHSTINAAQSHSAMLPVLLRVGAGLALGIGLSAFFLSSVLLERHYVTLSEALRLIYYNCFVFEHLGHLGNIKLFAQADYPGLDGYLAAMDVAAVGVVLLWVFSSLIIWRTSPDNEQGDRRKPLLIAVWALTTLSLFLTTRASTLIWRAIPQLEYMQCPDRWLVIAALGTCLLVACAFAAIRRSGKWRWVQGSLLGAAVLGNLLFGAQITTQRRFDPDRLWNRVSQLKEAPQYTPIWWDHQWHEEFEQAAVVVSRGEATITADKDSGVRQHYTLTVQADSVLKFRSLYFPGWTARLNGEVVPISPSEDGFIQLALPAGEYALTLTFEDTWQRTSGKIVSALSLITMLAMLYASRRRKRTNDESTSETGQKETNLMQLPDKE